MLLCCFSYLVLECVWSELYQMNERLRTGSLNQVHPYSRGTLTPEHSYPLSHWPKCHGQRLTCPHKKPPTECVWEEWGVWAVWWPLIKSVSVLAALGIGQDYWLNCKNHFIYLYCCCLSVRYLNIIKIIYLRSKIYMKLILWKLLSLIVIYLFL